MKARVDCPGMDRIALVMRIGQRFFDLGFGVYLGVRPSHMPGRDAGAIPELALVGLSHAER
jgi:hypothetical protein